MTPSRMGRSSQALLLGTLIASLGQHALAQQEIPAEQAQRVLTAEEERARRLGFYFSISLQRQSQHGQANGVGVVVDEPALPGAPFSVAGPEVNADFAARLNLGFALGFRLRNEKGRIEASYLQWDERQNLLTLAPEPAFNPGPALATLADRDAVADATRGGAIANTLASPLAGYFEDTGARNTVTGPDGVVVGFEAGSASEGSEQEDRPVDGAEDVNGNARPDFIRFDTSDSIVGEMATDLKLADLDYVRTIKKLRRFQLDARLGIRLVSLNQATDLAYRQNGRFGVYIDEEVDSPNVVIDGDGDGETSVSTNEADGDGFGEGPDPNPNFQDELDEVETTSEDRIVANIETAGLGLKAGVEGRYDLNRKWRVVGGIDVTAVKTDAEFAYRETFTSERDRFPNFIDWDLNGDGHYDMRDLDFDGTCVGKPLDECGDMTDADLNVIRNGLGYVEIRQRTGTDLSIVGPALGTVQARGVNTNAYQGSNFGHLRLGDPIPESERNRDVIRETTLLNDVRGSKSDVLPMLGVHAGLEYQFSPFASLSFGFRTLRWFDAGSFRSLANDVVAGRPAEIGGDFGMDGYYVTLTVVPR